MIIQLLAQASKPPLVGACAVAAEAFYSSFTVFEPPPPAPVQLKAQLIVRQPECHDRDNQLLSKLGL